MDITQPPNHALTVHLTSSAASLDLWHYCLDHLHANTITCMVDEDLRKEIYIKGTPQF